MTERITVTVRDACEMTGLSRTTLYNLFSDGSLPKLKVGGRTLIRVSDLRNLADSAGEDG